MSLLGPMVLVSMILGAVRSPALAEDSFAVPNVDPDISSPGGEETNDRCHQMLGVRKPVIQIDSVRGNGLFTSSQYEIRGSILSSCVEEAGYYESGKLKEKFEFPLEDRFRRREFIILVAPGHQGEIRVRTVDGREDKHSVDQEIRRERLTHLRIFP